MKSFMVAALALLFFGSTFAQTVSPWKMHNGKGVMQLQGSDGSIQQRKPGDPSGYKYLTIPASGDAGWKAAKVDSKGNINFTPVSIVKDCYKQIDFTYFETYVDVPANMKIDKFVVTFGKADDGARAYVFNSKHPKGAYAEGKDILINGAPVTGDLRNFVVAGERNRIVIAQFDICPPGNNLTGANIVVNGKEIAVAKEDCGKFELVGQWTFDGAAPLKDKKGNFGELTLTGGAKVDNGALDVGKGAYAKGTGYKGKALTEKTLVAWAKLDGMTEQGGSILTIDKKSKDEFDGIVFGERERNKWMAGSNRFARTSNLKPGYAENKPGEVVMMAISYGTKDGKAHVKAYRNGKMIGEYTQGSLASFKDDVEVLFGTRHTMGAAPRSYLDAHIEEARIYSGVLCQADIKKLKMEESFALDPNKYYRLSCKWQGESKCLAAVSSGNRIVPQLVSKSNDDSQYWKCTPVGNGYYRWTCKAQEGKSLDVINDGKNNKLQLAKTGSYTGQYWKCTPASGGYLRMTCKWQGEGKSLDVVNDGKNNKLQLANTGSYTGQFWKCTEVDPASSSASDEPVLTVYEHYDYRGKTQTFGVGYHKGYFKIGNDVISSLKIKKGYRVILYENGPGTGRELILTADTPNLGTHKFNDVTSNLKVEKTGVRGR